MRHRVLRAAACAAAIAFVLPLTPAAAFNGNDVAKTTDAGFTPDTGQINRGFDEKLPSDSQERKIPTQAEARAALMMPDLDRPTAGQQGTDANANAATTGAGSPVTTSAGPIGATGQTMPAILSKRNDILDRLPIMALPQQLSDQDRKHIYQAVMADQAPVASDAGKLAPASYLNPIQALNETHPLPASVSGIGGVQSLGYVKTKNKVFLVEPATRIVVEEIGL
jgi:hypothetical protein